MKLWVPSMSTSQCAQNNQRSQALRSLEIRMAIRDLEGKSYPKRIVRSSSSSPPSFSNLPKSTKSVPVFSMAILL